jgi:hypothetical protein
MINIHLSYIHCDEETDEWGRDEPYVLVAAVVLTPAIRGIPIQAPLASDVVMYPFRNFHTGGRAAFGIFESFWGIGGVPASLVNPDDAIFIVALMENDSGDQQVARGIVDTAVNASLIESLAISRPGKVTTLMRDLDSARRIPTGFPNFDDAIGAPQELRFSADELQRAELGQTVTKTMVFEGDGGRYTLMFDARNPEQWRRWFRIQPRTVFNQITPVAAVARSTDHLDIFKTDSAGTVWSNWWHEDPQGWRTWYQIHPQTVFAQDAPITVLARHPDHLDLFITGLDGAVWTSWRNEGQNWSPWFQIHPETIFRRDQEVVAVARVPEQIDLFTVGHDGAVWTSWWHGEGDPGGWRPWFQIRPETRFAVTSRVTAIARSFDHLDLFVTGLDGAVWSTWWHEDAEGWRPWFQIRPETVFDQLHPVAAVARHFEHIDLFKIGVDGAVWSTWWSPE